MEKGRPRHARATNPAYIWVILVIFAISCAESKGKRVRAPAPEHASGPASSEPADAPGSESAPAHAPIASQALFSYDEKVPTGPEKWGKLNKDWAMCGDGKKQSPIDISKVETDEDMGPLEQIYKAGTCIMENRGHDFNLQWKDGNGKLTVDKKDYTLRMVHWHIPSEHTVNGTRFDMEMHMVHEDSSMARAVVAVLFSTKEAGDPSKTLTNLAPYFKRLAGKDEEDEEVKEPVDPSVWVDKASGYYRYEGSLTTPPCTEGVLWTILSKVKHVSKEQIETLKTVSEKHEPNDRPTQEINDRVVRYFKGEETKDEPGAKKEKKA